MTLCYETLVDTGESDFVFFGSFIDPGNRDVLIVKDKKLILYRLLRSRLNKVVRNVESSSLEEREELLEFVHEYNVHGYIASANKLSKLIHYESLFGNKRVNGESEPEKEDNKYIDGFVLLLENYTLLTCYFNGSRGEFELIGRYNVHNMNLKDNEDAGGSLLSGKEESKQEEEQRDRKEYEDEVVVYDSEWEIYSKNNNCKIYYKNYLIIVKSRQRTLYIMNAQSYHNAYEGGVRGNNEVKMILTNYVKLNVNEKFNLDNNNLIKKVKLVKNYHSPLLCLLITNYTELINSIPINSNSEDDSSCSLLVLNVDVLTLNVVVINRTDNLLIDTEELEGYYFGNFIGFIGCNNDFVYWFKLFDNSGRLSSKVNYELTNIYGFFNNGLLKNESLNLINNTDLNLELYNHKLHILSPELVLLLPKESRASGVYLGKLIYNETNNLNNSKIVNIVWYRVNNGNLGGELVYGNCYDLLEVEGKLLMLNTSSDNLVQLLLLENYEDYLNDNVRLKEYLEEFNSSKEGETVSIKDLNLSLKFKHDNNKFEYFQREPGEVALHQVTRIRSLGQLKMLNNYNYNPFMLVNLEDLERLVVEGEQTGVREPVQSELRRLYGKLKELRNAKMNFVMGIRNGRNVVKMSNKCVAHLQAVLMSNNGSPDLTVEDGRVVYNGEYQVRLKGNSLYCNAVKKTNKTASEVELVGNKLLVKGVEVIKGVKFYDRFGDEYLTYVTECNTFCLYDLGRKKRVFKLSNLTNLNKRVYFKETGLKQEGRAASEEVLLCHLTRLKGSVFLVLLVTGHPVYVYKYVNFSESEALFGDFREEEEEGNGYFKLVKHNFVVPFPSVLLNYENNVYRLRVPSCLRRGNGQSLSPELVVLPYLSVNSEVLVDKFHGSESELLSRADAHYEEVLKAFRHRFDNFYGNFLNQNLVLFLKVEYNKLSLFHINLLVNMLDNNSTTSSSSMGNNCNNYNGANNNGNNNNNNTTSCTNNNNYYYYYHSYDRTFYVVNQLNGALYVYLLGGSFEYFYDNFRAFSDASLQVICQNRLKFVNQRAKGAEMELERSYGPTGLNETNGMLYEVFETVNGTLNFLTVSNDCYWLNRSNGSLTAFNESDAHSALDADLALGRLICLVVNLRDDVLDSLYHLLNLRNKLQLIHIANESTKLDKLNINRQLNVYIQFYQLISQLSSNSSYSSGSNNNNNNNPTNYNKLDECNNNYVLLLHSSDNFVSGADLGCDAVGGQCDSKNGLKVLSFYKLNAFNNVLDAKFVHLHSRERLVLGTCTNLGEYVESNGDVLILDFLNSPTFSSYNNYNSNSTSNNTNYGYNCYTGMDVDGGKRDMEVNWGKKEMELYYKKSFLYPITFVSSLDTQFNYRYNGNPNADRGALEDESEYSWLLNQLFSQDNRNNNYVIHSVGNDIYIHEFKSFGKPNSKALGPEKELNCEKSFVRGAFNNLYTCVSSLCIFNNFLLVGDFLKGLSFFLYVYDNKNDNKSIVRIGSTNPKINLSVLACCPLINANNLTLLASDDNNNLLQFVPNTNISSDKDFNDKVTQLTRYQFNFNNNFERDNNFQLDNRTKEEDLYTIMAVENGGAIYKLFMLKNNVFNILKKFELVYLNCSKNEQAQLHSHLNLYEFLSINADPNLVNLQHHLPNNNNSLLLLDLIKNVYFENLEFYKVLLNQLSLSQYSLFDLLNFIYKELYFF